MRLLYFHVWRQMKKSSSAKSIITPLCKRSMYERVCSRYAAWETLIMKEVSCRRALLTSSFVKWLIMNVSGRNQTVDSIKEAIFWNPQEKGQPPGCLGLKLNGRAVRSPSCLAGFWRHVLLWRKHLNGNTTHVSSDNKFLHYGVLWHDAFCSPRFFCRAKIPKKI